jgi:hypothetical protein
MRVLATLLAVVMFPGVAEATEDLAHWVAEGHTVHSADVHSTDVHRHDAHDGGVHDADHHHDADRHGASHDGHDEHREHREHHEHHEHHEPSDVGHDDARHENDEHGCSPLFHLCGGHFLTASVTSTLLALERGDASHHDVLSPPVAKDERPHDGVHGEAFRPPIT